VAVPPPGEYVADGAARQAAWVLSGQAAPPSWPGPEWATYRAAPAGGVRERYAAAREHVLPRTA
jgi:xylulokinase